MNKITKRLLACCCAWPIYANACDESGASILVNLQLQAGEQAPVEWPLLSGHIKSNVICIDKKLLKPALLQAAALPLSIHPLDDLIINTNNASQSIKANWQLDVYAVAGLPVVASDGKTYQPSCVIQRLDFQTAKDSVYNAGRFTLDAQAHMPALSECQGMDIVKHTATAAPVQWSLSASFILLGNKQKIAEMPKTQEQSAKVPDSKKAQDSKEDNPSKLEQFLNLPAADADAKKRMKKR